jgi:hypothetical protein
MGTCHLGGFATRMGSLLVKSHRNEGRFIMQYINDFSGASPVEDASASAASFDNKLQRVNLHQNEKKQINPSTKTLMVGMEIDTVAMQLSLPENKLKDLDALLSKDWSGKVSITEVRQLAGSLLHVSKLCPHMRLFISRIIDVTWVPSSTTGSDQVTFGSEALKDMMVWRKALHGFNGKRIMHESD